MLCRAVLCVTWGASAWTGASGTGSEGTVAVPPQQFPIRRYEARDGSGTRERTRGSHAASRKEVEAL